MAINPITVTRIKTVSLMGHSNGDGWGATQRLFENYNYLRPGTASPEAEPLEAYWKGVYVATSAQPYPSPNGTPTASDVGTVDWLELTVANTALPTDPHPHPTPYAFPNNQGACYPHYSYNAYEWGTGDPLPDFSVTPADPASTTIGVRHGVELPLMWAWRHYWQDQVGLVKMAFSSSLFSAAEGGANASNWLDTFGTSQYTPGDPMYVRSAIFAKLVHPEFSPGGAGTTPNASYRGEPYEFNAWWTPSDNFDWVPQTQRLYQKWYDRMVAAQAALPTGSQMDVQMVIPWFGDNDSGTVEEDGLKESFDRSWRALIKRVRRDLVANDWTTLNEKEIPIIIPNVHYAYVNGDNTPTFISVTYCNEILDEIAKQDPFVKIVDTHGATTIEGEGYGLLGITGSSHLGSDGYVQMSEAIMAAWESCRVDAYDALDQDDTITVAEAISKIKTYYAKSRANTDMEDATIIQHLDGAMNHVFNHVGDNAWWLKLRQQLTVTASTSGVTEMPKFVNRLLMIEDPQNPTYPLDFQQVGHGSGGRLQISFNERGTGTYWCQFITNPKELTRNDQIVPAPRNITEWIIVETCRRMAASSSNAPLMAFFGGEAMQLQSDSLRNMGQVERSKKDVMRTQRRRPNFGYGRIGGRWANDR